MKELLTLLTLLVLAFTAQAQIKPPKYQKVVKVYLNESDYEVRNVSIGLPGTETGSGRLSGSIGILNSRGNFHELELQHISWNHSFSWTHKSKRHLLTSGGLQIRYERGIRVAQKILDHNIGAYVGSSLSFGYGQINCYTDSIEGAQYQVRNRNSSLGVVFRGSLAITNRLSVETNFVFDALTFQRNRVKKIAPNFPENWNPFEHGNHWVENRFDGRIGIAVKL